MTELQSNIVNIVKARQRNVPSTRGVLPKTVQCFLDEYRAEQTLRRDMVSLWQQGLLDRLGGEGSRRGYRVTVARAESRMAAREPATILPFRIVISVQIRVA